MNLGKSITPPTANKFLTWIEDSVISPDRLENAGAVTPMSHQQKLTLEVFSIGIESMQVLL